MCLDQYWHFQRQHGAYYKSQTLVVLDLGVVDEKTSGVSACIGGDNGGAKGPMGFESCCRGL